MELTDGERALIIDLGWKIRKNTDTGTEFISMDDGLTWYTLKEIEDRYLKPVIMGEEKIFVSTPLVPKMPYSVGHDSAMEAGMEDVSRTGCAACPLILRNGTITKCILN